MNKKEFELWFQLKSDEDFAPEYLSEKDWETLDNLYEKLHKLPMGLQEVLWNDLMFEYKIRSVELDAARPNLYFEELLPF